MNDEWWESYKRRVHEDFCRDGLTKLCVYGADGNDVDRMLIEEYRVVLDAATDERPLQAYLSQHPQLVIGEPSGHCRWVIPQPRLGNQYVPDFLTVRLDSTGLSWTLIELESPKARLFTQEGVERAQLRKGISQILDWRRWLSDNKAYAQGPKGHNGLGLQEISDNARGLVIIGRRSHPRTDEDRARLRLLAMDRRIQVHSYDWLVSNAQKRLADRSAHGDGLCDECQNAA